jgi:hypothetical protein
VTLSAHTIRAVVVGGVTLDVQEATVTMDAGWAPYVQVDLTCRIHDLAAMYRLDPTASPQRVTVDLEAAYADSLPLADLSRMWAGKTLGQIVPPGPTLADLSALLVRPFEPGGTLRPPTRLSLDLSLRERSISSDSATVLLRLASDEAVLQDWAYLGAAPLDTGLRSVRRLAEYVLGQVGRQLEVDQLADGPVAPEAAIWDPGKSAWDFAAGPVQTADLRLWNDGTGLWHLTKANAVGSTARPVTRLTALTEHDDRTSMDGDWYDAVVIKYTWQDAEDKTQVRYDSASMKGYRKVRTLDMNSRWPGPGGARAVLMRQIGRAREAPVTAVSDYSCVPGNRIAITPPTGGPLVSGVVQSVQWAYPADEMRVTSRDLIERNIV